MSEESRNIQLEWTQIFLNKDSGAIRKGIERFKRRHRTKILVIRWGSAAAAILIVTIVVQFVRSRTNTTIDQPTFSYYRSTLPDGSMAQVQNQPVDVPTLTLSDNSAILLNSANNTNNGKLASEAGFGIIKEDDGHLAYLKAYDSPIVDRLSKKVYNILSTPSNAQSPTQILLPDGTLAYIGPGSTMKYPVADLNATPAARVIALRGEAYFDVAPDAQSPFIVETKNLEVSALGTAFRVNDYGRDGSREKDTSSVAALSGTVKVRNGNDSTNVSDNQEVVVRPIQQNQQTHGTQGTKGSLVSMQLYQQTINPLKMPGQLDYFEFTNRNLASIMQEISKWYGFGEPIFNRGVDPKKPGKYGIGPMPKRLSLRKLLDLLRTDDLHFTIDPEQKHIIVSN